MKLIQVQFEVLTERSSDEIAAWIREAIDDNEDVTLREQPNKRRGELIVQEIEEHPFVAAEN